VSRAAWIALLAAGIVLVGALVGASLLVRGSGAKHSPVSTVSGTNPVSQPISLPLENDPSALMLGQHKHDVLAGIAVRPGGPIEIALLRAETSVSAGQLTVHIDGRTIKALPCGPTCSRVRAKVLEGSPTRLSVQAVGTTFSFDLPARLPPTGKALFARAQRTMDRLRSFKFSERLSSGRGAVLTELGVQAPNRLELSTTSGFRAVIIGRSRWDYRGGRWEKSSFPGLNVSQVLMWYRATNPRIVGRRPGGRTELAAFSLDPVPSWFRLTVTPSGRVLEAEMTAASHFMLHRYRDFNGPFSIKPPARK
jgi:hypothetical protein